MVAILEDALIPVSEACEQVWGLVTSNGLTVFWVGTTVLSSGFWALRKARKIVK